MMAALSCQENRTRVTLMFSRISWVLVAILLMATVAFTAGTVRAQDATSETEVTAPAESTPTASAGGVVIVPPITINNSSAPVIVLGTPGSGDGLSSRAFDEKHPKYDLIIRLSLIGGIFLFAFVAILLLFRYLQSGLDKSFTAIAKANGHVSVVTIAPLATTQGPSTALFRSADALVPPTLIVSGPTEVTVGKSTVFLARFEPEGRETESISWALSKVDGTPTSGAALTSGSGEKSTLIVAEPGLYSLIVAAAGVGKVGLTVNARLEKETRDSDSRVSIPFIGQGYATVMLAIFLLLIVGVLTVNSNISATTTATLLGSMAGYIFGVTNPGSKDK